MALIHCSSCNQEVSEYASVCPHCGEKLSIGEGIIYCQECKNVIPLGSKICPNCGCPVAEVQDNQKGIDVKMNSSKPKRILMCCIMAAVVFAIIAAVVFILPVRLDPTEQYVADIVKDLIGGMKDPDSFKLHDDIMYIEETDDAGNDNIYVFIKNSSNNSYGIPLVSTSMYKNGVYMGEFEDDEPYNNPTTKAEYEANIEFGELKLKYLGFAIVTEAAKSGFISNYESEAERWISKETIANYLKISYVED